MLEMLQFKNAVILAQKGLTWDFKCCFYSGNE